MSRITSIAAHFALSVCSIACGNATDDDRHVIVEPPPINFDAAIQTIEDATWREEVLERDLCLVAWEIRDLQGAMRYRYTAFDGSGRIIHDAFDDDNDGTIEYLRTIEYNEGGHGVLARSTNGNSEGWVRMTRDDSGRLLVRENGAGDLLSSPERIFTYYYDDGSAWTRQSQDYDGDGFLSGKLDRTVTRQHTYSASGELITRTTWDHESDGTIDWDNSYEYDEAGRTVVSTFRDLTGSLAGTVRTNTSTYDEQGRLLTTVYDTNRPEEYRTTETRSYDGDFLVAREQRTPALSNRLDYHVTFSYEGPCPSTLHKQL